MYKYSPDECDVLDKERLCRFRRKREEWLSWLRDDEWHSIWGQINSLLWDDVLFRTINDLRRKAAENPQEDVGFNPDVLRLLDAGFVTTQVTAIRRLTDRPDRNRDPKKGIISLRRLVSDVRDNLELFTREIYVAYDGLPYDFATAQDAWYEKKIAAESLT